MPLPVLSRAVLLPASRKFSAKALCARSFISALPFSPRCASLSASVSVSACSSAFASFSSAADMGSAQLSVRVARYSQFGPAEQSIRVLDETLSTDLKDDEILINMLAAPINPADINMIEGVYNIRPPLPAIGGNEGVGVVLKTGSSVSSMKVGDWVIPAEPGFGTWRSHAVAKESAVDTIANDIPAEAAATIAVNPCTAYRMLHDFVSLRAGDVILQNGANSSVGLCVIQLARHFGYRTINVIRDRPNVNELIDKLKGLGADLVVTEDQMSGKGMADLLKNNQLEQKQIKLGLNCVGGSSAAEITRWLADHAPLVTYGGMSRRPVNVPTGRLIFNDITLKGFWLSGWTMKATREDRKKMLNCLTDFFRTKKLTAFVEKAPFSQFQTALQKAVQGYKENKIVLTFDK